MISNACLTGFDDELESHCRANALTYTRYADDIVISAQNREELQNIELQRSRTSSPASTLFRQASAQFPQKSKVTTVGRKVKVLGMVITPSGRVTVDMELKRRIEVLLHFYIRDREKFSAMVEHNRRAGIEQLVGYVNYINTADKLYLEKLRKKYGTTVIDSFLHRSAT